MRVVALQRIKNSYSIHQWCHLIQQQITILIVLRMFKKHLLTQQFLVTTDNSSINLELCLPLNKAHSLKAYRTNTQENFIKLSNKHNLHNCKYSNSSSKLNLLRSSFDLVLVVLQMPNRRDILQIALAIISFLLKERMGISEGKFQWEPDLLLLKAKEVLS